MLDKTSPLTDLSQALQRGRTKPIDVARDLIQHANSNASQNTYLHFDPEGLLRQADSLKGQESSALFGIPISLKDCFDLAGTRTTSGSRFYSEQNSPATQDSSIARNLKRAGALITGKTHLHPLAYGITGQNPDYGNCLQPRDESLLTGGSSSGGAASVQEGSALAAIGTDTGGSIRVPAALCGLAGYRASHNIATPSGWFPDLWKGAAHLAPSFDTIGLILRDPRDLSPIAHALFGIPVAQPKSYPRVGYAPASFLYDSEPEVLTCLQQWKSQLLSAGAELSEMNVDFWSDSLEIFAGIQAYEASILHHGNYDRFEPAIRDRLRWGATLSGESLSALHVRRQAFVKSIDSLLKHFDFLILPASPVTCLQANSDLSNARQQILRYTTPFSLAGLPAISLPGELIGAPFGTGVQIAAAPGADPMLLAFSSSICNSFIR